MSAARIDPRAIVSPEASLGEGVEVGPFTVIEPGAVIGSGTRILAHAYVCTGTTLGSDNVVHMNAVLGHEPQDLAYRGAPTRLVIGDRNVFREGVTVHRGTVEGSETRIGNDCFLMANAHVAHNCRVDDRVIMANGALLGGYVEIGERVFLSGNAVVHQHRRVGRLAILQGCASLSQDLPPFLIGSKLNELRGVNLVGLRRAGFDRSRISAIRLAYRVLFFHGGNLSLARERLLAHESLRDGPGADVRELLDFIAGARHGVGHALTASRGSPAPDPAE